MFYHMNVEGERERDVNDPVSGSSLRHHCSELLKEVFFSDIQNQFFRKAGGNAITIKVS